MIAALRTPRHAITSYRSTTHPSTRISTPSESPTTSPSGRSRVGSVLSRALDFAGRKKLNALFDVKWDDKNDKNGGEVRDDRRKGRAEEMEEPVSSVLDLKAALQTIPSEDDSKYPQPRHFPIPLGKAAQILGLDKDQEPLAMMDIRASQLLREEYFDTDSLASDAAEGPYGPPGPARQHFCSGVDDPEGTSSLFPASRCCWGGHVGPTYLDHLEDNIDEISLRSSIAPAPTTSARQPVPISQASSTITAVASTVIVQPTPFAHYGRDRTGWPRERPYPYMMERDVEPMHVLAGRDAVEGYSRYPSIPRRQLIN